MNLHHILLWHNNLNWKHHHTEDLLEIVQHTNTIWLRQHFKYKLSITLQYKEQCLNHKYLHSYKVTN